MHSFTPVYLGVAWPWAAGILYRHSATFAARLVDALGSAAEGIAQNQPCRIEDDSDYTVRVDGEARGLDAVLVELRQDLIANPADARAWADRLAQALQGLPAG